MLNRRGFLQTLASVVGTSVIVRPEAVAATPVPVEASAVDRLPMIEPGSVIIETPERVIVLDDVMGFEIDGHAAPVEPEGIDEDGFATFEPSRLLAPADIEIIAFEPEGVRIDDLLPDAADDETVKVVISDIYEDGSRMRAEAVIVSVEQRVGLGIVTILARTLGAVTFE